MIDATLAGFVIFALGVAAGVGRATQRLNSMERRTSKLEGMLSSANPDGPAFVHKSLFDQQNKHIESLVAEMKANFNSLEERVDETNRLLGEVIAHLD